MEWLFQSPYVHLVIQDIDMITKIQISSIVSAASINDARAMEAVDLEAEGQGITFTFTMPIAK